jgi:hypothetical protein
MCIETSKVLNMRMATIISALLASLTGCGGGGSSDSTSNITPILAASSAAEVNLSCSNWRFISSGDTAVENNIWGYRRATFTDWHQCIGIGTTPTGDTVARWTWDWKNEPASGIKAYPEIIYGKKPAKPSTNTKLPIKVQDIQEMTLDLDYVTAGTGEYQMLIDLWITSTANADTWDTPPVTREIMINIEKSNYCHPIPLCELYTIGGRPWGVHIGNYPNTWQRISFSTPVPLTGNNLFDLKAFLDYLKSIGELRDDEYVSSIEFGTEVYSGQGETRVNKFRVNVK